MEQKLGFLRKYKRNAQLISCHEINKLDCGKIPNSWYKLFQEENVDQRVEIILSLWKEQVGVELRNTISYLSKHLEEVDLMDINGGYSILYTIKTDNGEIRYYEGGNPKDEFNNEELEKSWGYVDHSEDYKSDIEEIIETDEGLLSFLFNDNNGIQGGNDNC